VNIVHQRIPAGTTCKNPQCGKVINATQDYIHVCRAERSSSTGNHEFFCSMQCCIAYEKSKIVSKRQTSLSTPYFA